jgi:hypothetical protein
LLPDSIARNSVPTGAHDFSEDNAAVTPSNFRIQIISDIGNILEPATLSENQLKFGYAPSLTVALPHGDTEIV